MSVRPNNFRPRHLDMAVHGHFFLHAKYVMACHCHWYANEHNFIILGCHSFAKEHNFIKMIYKIISFCQKGNNILRLIHILKSIT